MFVIDTDSYAGNFERDMCAYVTGLYGDCSVGEEIALSVQSELAGYEFDVESRPDDKGCFRPASIYPTPGWSNNGNGKHTPKDPGLVETYDYPAYNSVAIYFYEKPSEGLIEVMKTRARVFAKGTLRRLTPGKIKIEGFRLIQEETVTTSENV